MHTEPQNEQKTTQQSRRQFLTRTTAGVVIAALPAKSVWAADGNILHSIVASGHGSDFARGKRIQLLSQGKIKTQLTQYYNYSKSFNEIFGGEPFDKNLFPATVSGTYTFKQLLDKPGKTLAGPGNVNLHMIALFVAADITDGDPEGTGEDLYYPVVRDGGLSSPIEFAKHLYTAVKEGRINGEKLRAIINCYHVGTTGTGSCGILP